MQVEGRIAQKLTPKLADPNLVAESAAGVVREHPSLLRLLAVGQEEAQVRQQEQPYHIRAAEEGRVDLFPASLFPGR